jgi:hypothetical protein
MIGATVSSDFFSVLRTNAMHGRTFTPDEEQPGRDQVVVISHGMRPGNIDVSLQLYLGYAYARAGQRKEAQAILSELQKSKQYVSPAEFAISTSDWARTIKRFSRSKELTMPTMFSCSISTLTRTSTACAQTRASLISSDA